ncbi:hypothetical protein [Pedobacter sp.]|uniref:hypothetical protein n=1 Tax=Pedobacter sp. TaxID=1411316 RepID=UPI003C491350
MENYKTKIFRECRADGTLYFFALVTKSIKVLGFINWKLEYAVGSSFSDKPVLQDEKYFGHEFYNSLEECQLAAKSAIKTDFDNDLYNKVIKVERV